MIAIDPIYINCGGPAYTTIEGLMFQADAFFSGGNTFPQNMPIACTDDDPLYQTERWAANLTYDLNTLPDGDYIVDLYFAELFFGGVGNN